MDVVLMYNNFFHPGILYFADEITKEEFCSIVFTASKERRLYVQGLSAYVFSTRVVEKRYEETIVAENVKEPDREDMLVWIELKWGEWGNEPELYAQYYKGKVIARRQQKSVS